MTFRKQVPNELAPVFYAQLLLALVLALGLAGPGCGDQTTGTTNTQAPAARPALEAKVPVLRWIPPQAELVAIGKGPDLLVAAEQLAAAAPGLDLSVLGAEPWNAELWSTRGVDLASPLGLFVSGVGVNLVLPVSDPAVLSAWSTSLGAAHTQQHGDRELRRIERGATRLSWLQVDGFAILHISMTEGPMAEGDGLEWLDAMLAASEGSAYSASAEAEAAHAMASPGRIWGSADPLPLLATLVGGPEYLACTDLLGKMQDTVFAASLTGAGASIQTSLAIGQDATATFAGLRAPGASEGMRQQRESAGVYASLAMDLQSTGRALQERGCSELARTIQDPLASVGWSPPPRAVHVAGTHLYPSDLSGVVALEVALHSKRFIQRQLGQIPGRSWFESSIKVEGQRAKRLSIPTMSSVYYQLSDDRFVFATKKGIMKTLLSPPREDAGAAADEMVALGIWPERLPQLGKVLELVVPSREQRVAISNFLGRLDHARFSIALKGSRLTMQAEMKPRQSAPAMWLGGWR